MGQAGSNWERGWRLARAFGLVALGLLFVIMPDKTVALISAVARLAIGLFLAKLAWDHGPEVKSLLQGVVDGSLSLKGLGFEVEQAKKRDEAAQQELSELPRLLGTPEQRSEEGVQTPRSSGENR